jgi:glycosyltransferase involved in cell wall biosynthesis
MNVSLICTVRDEEDTIAALLDSVLAQTRRPDEMIVNDDGCRDRTMAIVEGYRGRLPLHTTRCSPESNVSRGRNAAIRAARGPLVACTDAGLRLDRRWLEEIVAPLERGEADLVAGFYRSDPRTPFERVLGAVNYSRLEEVDPAKFLPAGQSMAFARALWEAVGGFPEEQPYCEDFVFTLRALRRGYRKSFAPNALVHFRPRSSLGALFRQYRNYAYGDGLANLWPRRHLLRYATYALALTLAVAGLSYPCLWVGVLIPGAMYLGRYYARLGPDWRALPSAWRIAAIFLVPLIRLVDDVAKMVGYPRGAWEHRRRFFTTKTPRRRTMAPGRRD